ncbi:CMP-5'-phosphonoformate--3-phosphoglycerate phosphonoformyl transferase [Kitasatospora sp. NPDC094011]|uniref:CMP-5'-phosphonoformate--3-phosphoglycerate phosphonoformyl transferase n=1 Tax=Kitasatospora sp. NPDC094011 TaxID=3364090 RepID=UPI003813B6D1
MTASVSSTADGKVYVLALCGGADRPIGALGGRTPLEAADTPHLDALAVRGASTLVEVIGPGIPPESDSGAMALLGYDPLLHYTGRGPLEGFGAGYWHDGGSSVAFRINFGSLDPASGRLDRRTSRDLTDPELEALVAEITAAVDLGPGIRLSLTGWGRHRGILALTSTTVELSGAVSNTDPGFVKDGAFGVPVAEPADTPLPCRPLQDGPAARRTADLVDAFVTASARVLASSPVNHARTRAGRKPANVILVRDGGHTLPVLAPAGRSTSMYGQVPAEQGLAALMGARFTRSRPRADQPVEAYYSALVPALLADPAEVVFVHVKGPDEPGHDRQVRAKVRAIAALDAHLVGPLTAALTPSDTVVVTCDHSTPCELGIHAPDPVPLTVAGPGVAADDCTAFGERASARGALPLRRACELMDWLFEERPC